MILSKNTQTVLLILIAFAFSFSVRLIWVEHFSDTQQFKFNGEFMINTNDGYYWAEGARDILAGNLENTNDLSPKKTAASQLTAFVAHIVPFSFETVIFYMPAFFASLVVIPIILIAREFDRLGVGFIAALIGSIAWSYYNRTMVGYYDTDLLNIVFPTILLWSLIWALKTGEDKYLLIAALDSIAYRWWYPQSYALEFAFIALIGVYIAYQALKKQSFHTNLLLLSFMIFAMVNIDGWIRFAIVLGFYAIVKAKKELVYKYLFFIFGFALLLFLVTGGLDPIWGKLKGYVFKDEIAGDMQGLRLQFFTVMQTVREAGAIPFETFANRISGHTITFIASIIGYIWFCARHPIMLLALPMVGLGFLAYGIPGIVPPGGLRFTIYAVPIMALGIGFLIIEIAKALKHQLIHPKLAQVVYYSTIVGLTLAILYPNIMHIQAYKVPTVFTNQEVKVLDKLKHIAQREDYVVSWWDYGYPIRYYSDVKTLIDGGKHSGKVNFPVSFVLTNPQDVAAKMARLDVEYTQKRFDIKQNNENIDENHTDYIKWASSNIEQMTLDYDYNDTNNFLTSLATDITLPPKSRDIFLYLPSRMLSIFPTVTLFSNIDLMSGKKGKRPFFYQTKRFENSAKTINLGNNIQIIKDKGSIQIGQQTLKIKNFITTHYTRDGSLQVKRQIIDKNSPLSVIYMKSYNQFLVLDTTMFNSTFIQMFVLENYDRNLYEPVVLDPLAKVYKLKI